MNCARRWRSIKLLCCAIQRVPLLRPLMDQASSLVLAGNLTHSVTAHDMGTGCATKSPCGFCGMAGNASTCPGLSGCQNAKKNRRGVRCSKKDRHKMSFLSNDDLTR